MTFSTKHAMRYVVLAAALATLGGCATPQQQQQQLQQQQLIAAKIQQMRAQQEAASQPGQIGVLMDTNQDGSVTVAGIAPGTDAAESGDLKVGDRITAVAEEGAEPESLTGKSFLQTVGLIRGAPGSQVRLIVTEGDSSREVSLTRAELSEQQAQALAEIKQAKAEEQVEGLAIEDNSGEYLSPYTSDGVTAEWVNKAINAKMGSAAGSAVGAAAGAYAGRKALESVPGGSLIGSFFGGMAGSKAGQNVGRDAAIEASGGWDYIRQTSDLSFRSLNDMARWMTTVHGQKSNFQEVLNATLQVYPELQPALASAR